jgi:hypothetical protein
MTSDFWIRIRRLFVKRSPSQSVEHIVAGYRAGVPPKNPVLAYSRERFDLMRGWVREDQEAGLYGLAHRRFARHPAHRRTRGR